MVHIRIFNLSIRICFLRAPHHKRTSVSCLRKKITTLRCLDVIPHVIHLAHIVMFTLSHVICMFTTYHMSFALVRD